MRTGLPFITLLTFGGVALLAGTAEGQAPGLPAYSAGVGFLPGVGAAVENPPAPHPKALLEQAISILNSRTSITAKLRQQVNLFVDKQLIGAGTYVEQRAGGSQRYAMESRIWQGSQLSSIRLCCDGLLLWKYQCLSGRPTLTRIDVTRVLQALNEAGQRDQMGRVGDWPGMGGLAGMLRGLDANFDFQSAQPTRLAGSAIENARVVSQLPVWELRGQWNRRRLAAILPGQAQQILAGQPVDLSAVPTPLPQQVVIYLGSEDLFPYRVVYLRQGPAQREGQGGEVLQPILTMDLFEVQWNVPVDTTNFVYNPRGNLEWKDQTNEYLESLGLAR
jgi:hypothetical protein